MTRRLFLLSILVLLTVLTGCGSGIRKFPSPVTSAEALRLGDVWMKLQTEMNLDPARPSWVEDMRWEFEPDGKLRQFYMQVRATEVGAGVQAIYQVGGGTGDWRWFKVVENPKPRRDLPPVGGLFGALDRFGFPGTYLSGMQPASYYSVNLLHISAPPADAVGRVLEKDSIREWTAADTERYKGSALPMLHIAEMVPMASQSPNTKAFASAGQVFFAVPEAAAR